MTLSLVSLLCLLSEFFIMSFFYHLLHKLQWLLIGAFSYQKRFETRKSLPPYLFSLVMEYPMTRLNELYKNPDFNFHPCRERFNLTHLIIADDLLLFAYGK